MLVEEVGDGFFEFVLESLVAADELSLGDGGGVVASGSGGALVVGCGVGEVRENFGLAVLDIALDRVAEVASFTGEDRASGCCALGTALAPFDLLPAGAEEALVLEVLLKFLDGSLAKDIREVVVDEFRKAVGEAVEADVERFLFHRGSGLNGFNGQLDAIFKKMQKIEIKILSVSKKVVILQFESRAVCEVPLRPVAFFFYPVMVYRLRFPSFLNMPNLTIK